jgi:negative modulator of initiation of replication
MKNIDIDDELYQYIVKNTQQIGESASSILRRLLAFETVNETPLNSTISVKSDVENEEQTAASPKNADSLFNYINKEELAMQRGAVGRFLLILAALYRVHPKEFALVLEIRGKGRLYFAKNIDDLEASGSSTKPKQIAQSPYWVITNTNTTRKKMMLTEAAKELGYSQIDAEKIRELL